MADGWRLCLPTLATQARRKDGHPEIRLPAGRLRCSYANELCKRSAQGLEFKIAFRYVRR